LEQVKKMHIDGVDVFIGPQTSAELGLLKPYADSEHLLIISTSSTAPSLAIADNIYRLVPDDTNQARLLSKILEDNGSPTVLLLVRDDVWGNGLANAIKESYSGEVSQINYDPESPLYEKTLQDLSELVTTESQRSDVVIGVIGFGETAEFLSNAIQFDVLDDVVWFGTDSNANEQKIIQDEQIASFAQKVSFRAIQFASDYGSPLHENVESKLFVDLGYLPSTYAYAAYDAVWVLGLSMLDADSIDPNTLGLAIPDVVTSYRGTLGDLRLNDAGDLISDNYDVWSVVEGKWYKGNFREINGTGLVQKIEDGVITQEQSSPTETETTLTEQSSPTETETTLTEQSSPTETNLLVLVLIVLIIIISSIATFSVWRLKKSLTKLKNSTHIDKPEPTP
jgi:branched-chain amino acid transport system substrate-binding protein